MLIGMNQPLQCHRYRRILLAMMTYKDGIEYATDYEFSLEQVADIKRRQFVCTKTPLFLFAKRCIRVPVC